jgi:hypothetical protein
VFIESVDLGFALIISLSFSFDFYDIIPRVSPSFLSVFVEECRNLLSCVVKLLWSRDRCLLQASAWPSSRLSTQNRLSFLFPLFSAQLEDTLRFKCGGREYTFVYLC